MSDKLTKAEFTRFLGKYNAAVENMQKLVVEFRKQHERLHKLEEIIHNLITKVVKPNDTEPNQNQGTVEASILQPAGSGSNEDDRRCRESGLS